MLDSPDINPLYVMPEPTSAEATDSEAATKNIETAVAQLYTAVSEYAQKTTGFRLHEFFGDLCAVTYYSAQSKEAGKPGYAKSSLITMAKKYGFHLEELSQAITSIASFSARSLIEWMASNGW